MAVGERTIKLLIEAMAKHLPPSASTLKLLDVDGRAGEILSASRADLAVTVVQGDPAAWGIESGGFDAVVAFDRANEPALLAAALNALRPGGRFIMVALDESQSGQIHVQTLERAGFARILVELGIECPLPVGTLMRGEKPHVTADTLERVKTASDQDADQVDWAQYNGRYVFLLIRQTPHKPAWALTPDDPIVWHAAAIELEGRAEALAFSSLPKAVAFMQPAVLAKQISGVTKMAKFSRETAQAWPFPARINPPVDNLSGAVLTWIEIDPTSAAAPDE